MGRTYLWLAALGICLLLLMLASASAPRMMLRASRPKSAAEAESLPAVRPRAVVEETHFDFGVMDPLTMATHAFTVRNEGQAPLELTAGETTCKCTLSELAQRAIPPGGSGEVRLTWNTGSKHGAYSHGATIHTNDPLRDKIELRVRGSVRVLLAAVPEQLVLDRVEPDQPAEAIATVYSELWETFAIQDVRCSLAEARCEVLPAPADEVARLQGKSGYRVRVVLPAGMPDGFFNELVTLEIAPPGQDAPQTLEIPLSGKVLKRLAVYGPGVDELGRVDLGVQKVGTSQRKRLTLKLRDPDTDLRLREIRVQPEFVRAQVTPYRTEGSAAGLYHLDIEIPETAPVCAHRVELGKLELYLDHPRVHHLELKLMFAVLDAQ